MKLTLPNALRRAELRSFCLAVSSIALIALALMPSFSSAASSYAALATICACLLGLIVPTFVRIPYRIWNKSAKIFVRFAHYYLLGVVFHGIVRGMSVVAASAEFSQNSHSLSSWVRRAPVSSLSYESLYEMPAKSSARVPWLFRFMGWAWHTTNIPAMCLLPFLLMLCIFQPEEESEKISDIYTLF